MVDPVGAVEGSAATITATHAADTFLQTFEMERVTTAAKGAAAAVPRSRRPSTPLQNDAAEDKSAATAAAMLELPQAVMGHSDTRPRLPIPWAPSTCALPRR